MGVLNPSPPTETVVERKLSAGVGQACAIKQRINMNIDKRWDAYDLLSRGITACLCHICVGAILLRSLPFGWSGFQSNPDWALKGGFGKFCHSVT